MQMHSKTPEETMEFAQSIQSEYPNHKVWLLSGDLASGKTTFVKGLSDDPQSVKSPTFAFMTEHAPFIHYDLYRLETVDALLEEQLEEDINRGKLLLIEWPERLEKPLDIPHLLIEFTHKGGNERSILVTES